MKIICMLLRILPLFLISDCFFTTSRVSGMEIIAKAFTVTWQLNLIYSIPLRPFP